MRTFPLWTKKRYAAAWLSRADAGGELTYVALGDSAAQGLGATTPARGYVGLLANIAEEVTGLSVRVLNLSVTGAKAQNVLDTQIPQLARLTPDLITLAVGGNDMRKYEASSFEQTMGAIIRSLPPHALIADVPCFYNGRGEEKSKRASAQIRRLADAGGQPFVDLHAPTEAIAREEYRTHFALDMFHPSDLGYRVWAGAFEPAWRARLAELSRT